MSSFPARRLPAARRGAPLPALLLATRRARSPSASARCSFIAAMDGKRISRQRRPDRRGRCCEQHGQAAASAQLSLAAARVSALIRRPPRPPRRRSSRCCATRWAARRDAIATCCCRACDLSRLFPGARGELRRRTMAGQVRLKAGHAICERAPKQSFDAVILAVVGPAPARDAAPRRRAGVRLSADLHLLPAVSPKACASALADARACRAGWCSGCSTAAR